MPNYDSYSDTSAPEPDSHDSEPEKEDEDSESAGSSALLPKSLFSGKDFKVGDEIVLKITHLYEDQFSAVYAPEKSSEHTESEDPDYSGEMSMKE